MSYGRTLNTIAFMLKITRDLAQCRVIERLLLDEEAKLKKYEEDHKRE